MQLRALVKGAGWSIPGELRLFANADRAEAMAWIGEGPPDFDRSAGRRKDLMAISPVPIIAVILTLGAATGLAQLGLSTGDAVGSIVVFVVVARLTIAVPVVYYLVGGGHAKAELDSQKGWLALHNAAVMTVLFLVFGSGSGSKATRPGHSGTTRSSALRTCDPCTSRIRSRP